MKTKQIIKGIFAGSLVMAVIGLSACSSDSAKQQEVGHDAHGHDSSVHAQEVPAVAVSLQDAKADAVYQHYIHLKNALVSGEAKDAQSAAAALQTAISDAGNTAGADWAGKIASVSDVDAQRGHLEPLTAEVEPIIRSSKVASGVIYKQYCPMANNNEGGYWLSNESGIKNPYFGESMMTCGETKEEIK